MNAPDGEIMTIKNAALGLRIPLGRADVPLVKAVRGQVGIVEGADYRGIPVIAAALYRAKAGGRNRVAYTASEEGAGAPIQGLDISEDDDVRSKEKENETRKTVEEPES